MESKLKSKENNEDSKELNKIEIVKEKKKSKRSRKKKQSRNIIKEVSEEKENGKVLYLDPTETLQEIENENDSEIVLVKDKNKLNYK